MPTYRVNTPGPSFTVEADNLDQATNKAVTRGLPVDFMEGHVVTQSTVPVLGGRVLRYVQVFVPERGMDEAYTGFVLYQEVCSGCGEPEDLERVVGAPGGTVWCFECRAQDAFFLRED